MDYFIDVITRLLSNTDKMEDLLIGLLVGVILHVIEVVGSYLAKRFILGLKALWSSTTAYFKKDLGFVPLLKQNRIQNHIIPSF